MPRDIFGTGLDQNHVPVPGLLPELRIAIWQGCGAGSGKRHKIVIGAGKAEHGAAHRAGIHGSRLTLSSIQKNISK